jgi:hypothetical protein
MPGAARESILAPIFVFAGCQSQGPLILDAIIGRKEVDAPGANRTDRAPGHGTKGSAANHSAE